MFTDNAGLQSIIDRGGRSIKSKRGRLLTFARLDLTYFKSDKTGMAYLTEVEPVESFRFEKEGGIGRLIFASAAMELLAALLPESEPMESLYILTIDYLKYIDRVDKHAIIPLFICYLLKLLSFLGYRPNLAGCIGCGTETEKITMANSGGNLYVIISPERGGLICSTCQKTGEYYIKLRSERLDKIYSLQTASLAEAISVRMKLDETEEVLELLTRFLKYQTDNRDLNSLKFLEKLKKTNLKI